jgi:plastocyanin
MGKQFFIKIIILFFVIFLIIIFALYPLILNFKPINISTKNLNIYSQDINLNDRSVNNVLKESNLNLNENMIVFITDKGFEPQKLEIKKDTTVIWFNLQNKLSWPMSKSASNKCHNLYKNQIFNTCHGLKNGESWSFTFNERGEWIYYDYLNPQWEGKILVK